MISKMDFFIGMNSAYLHLANAHSIAHIALLPEMDDTSYSPWMTTCFYHSVLPETRNAIDARALTNVVDYWTDYHKAARDQKEQLASNAT